MRGFREAVAASQGWGPQSAHYKRIMADDDDEDEDEDEDYEDDEHKDNVSGNAGEEEEEEEEDEPREGDLSERTAVTLADQVNNGDGPRIWAP